MSGRLEGKVAFVTGGGSGIGRATALAFHREGARLAVADLNVEGGKETVRLIQEAAGEAFFAPMDVTKAVDVEAAVNRVVESYGRLDCAFNNAGTEGRGGAVADCTEENWDRVVNTNLKGVWLCLKYEISQMLKQHSGAIVNMSSMLGLLGAQGVPAYVASKHGVSGLTKAAALEYARSGIRINAVCPGWIRTPMFERATRDSPQAKSLRRDLTPVGRVGTAEEVAEAVVWLCSDAASFIMGHLMTVDGGMLAGIHQRLLK